MLAELEGDPEWVKSRNFVLQELKLILEHAWAQLTTPKKLSQHMKKDDKDDYDKNEHGEGAEKLMEDLDTGQEHERGARGGLGHSIGRRARLSPHVVHLLKEMVISRAAPLAGITLVPQTST